MKDNGQREALKLGLIGLGNMGQNHLRVLSMLKSVDLRFVYDMDSTRLNELAAQYDCHPSVDLDADLLGVDAVVLATPTVTHYDYIRKIAKHVRNIFVEKPLTEDLKTSEEILRLTEEKGLRIQVGFIERFNPAVLGLKKVMSEKERIVNIDFARTNKLSSRISDVDVVTDLMIHDIDLALLLNGPVCGLSAYGVVSEGMIAFARATLTHETGAFSNITASRITEKRVRQISATCTDKFIDCNLLRKEVVINKQTVEQYYEKVSISSQEETVDVRPEEALLNELVAFVDFSSGGTSDVPTEEDGYNAMKLAQEIQGIIRGNP